MKLINKKILVTGGSGFIGSNLILKLKKYGAKVENFDLSQGYDIQNEKQLKQQIVKKFDVIYHLAGFSGSPRSNDETLKTFKINTFSTINLLNLIKNYSPETKVIFSNSRLEYGKPRYLPVDETHPTVPISAYGISKLAATQVALIYHEAYKLDVTIIRTSNVYGPFKKSKFLGYNIVNHFIELAQKNETIKIFGNGKQERDYIYMDDLVEAFIKAACSKSNGQIYNLGFGKGIKFKDMVNLIIEKVKKGKMQFVAWPVQYREVETGSYISDIKKIKRELSFQPKVNLEEGIERILNET